MARSDVRMVTMREFRLTFPDISEPVKVVRARGKIEVIGTWTPKKAEAPAERTENAA